MTPEQALTLLKDAYLDDEHATIRSLNIADYHALLSLLEGMRWKLPAVPEEGTPSTSTPS